MARWTIAALTLLVPWPAAARDSGPHPSDAPSLSYVVPYLDGFAPDDVSVPVFKAGTDLYAAVGVALREEPRADAPPVRWLAAGARLKVVKGDAAVVDESGFVHRWVAVETADTHERGHVFGAFVTPLSFAEDLDGDGRTEVVTVGFTKDAQAIVRVFPPGRPSLSLSFAVKGGGYFPHRGGLVRARIVPASEAGIALVRVFTGQEGCSSDGTAFVSFVAAPGDAAPRPRVAFETSGLTDPPNFARPEERFDPRSRTVEVRTKVTTEDESGRPRREPDQVERRRLRDGVYEIIRER